ncbi:MAG: hypothetical protein B6D34_11235 [Candidatus Brocadia sp. UTAMX1]|nr:MAG: hypothetical protein B6D34_11235 [Candidatus Brocadia sp. UTAMX1]
MTAVRQEYLSLILSGGGIFLKLKVFDFQGICEFPIHFNANPQEKARICAGIIISWIIYQIKFIVSGFSFYLSGLQGGTDKRCLSV